MTAAAASKPDAPPFEVGSFLDANAAALGLTGQTLEQTLGSPARGELLVGTGGAPILRVDGYTLGEPLDEATIRKELTGHPDRAVVVVLGLGTGNVVRTVRALTDSPVVAFEPDPGVLRKVLEHGPTDLGGVRVVSTVHDLGQAWESVSGHEPRAVLFRTPGYSEAYPDDAAALTDTVRQLVQRTSINENTHQLRSRTWIVDLIANLKWLTTAPAFTSLEGLLKGVPAFIVGSGPSLEKNVELLKVARRKGLVLSANSAARALAASDVEPQVVACIESIDVSHRLADLPFIDRVVRAFSLAAHPRVLETGKGPLLHIHEGIAEISVPLEPLVGGRGLAVCGSVTTILLSLAERLGCSPIVLVGQDLAYTDGHPYAAGTGYESSRANVSRETGTIALDWNQEVHDAHGDSQGAMFDRELLYEVERWGGGGTVPTGAGFNAVRAWFETAAVVLGAARPDLALVNSTEGGARIAGFVEKPLADVVAALPDRSVSAEGLASDARAAGRTVPVERVIEWLDHQLEVTRRTRRSARRAERRARHAKAAITADDPRAITAAFAALDEVEVELRKALAEAPLVESWSLGEVTRALGSDVLGPMEARTQALHGVEQEIGVARAVHDSTRSLERELRRARERLKE